MQDTKISDKWKLSSPATIKNVWKPKKKKEKKKNVGTHPETRYKSNHESDTKIKPL